MRKGFLYIILLGSLLTGVTLGRCLIIEEIPNLQSRPIEGHFVVVKNDFRETYEPPSTWGAYLHNPDLHKVFQNIQKSDTARNLLAHELAYFHGECLFSVLIQTVGFGISFMSPTLGGFLASCDLPFNGFLSNVLLGKTLRAKALLPLVEPLVGPAVNTSWWAAKKTGRSAWNFGKWFHERAPQVIESYEKRASQFWGKMRSFFSSVDQNRFNSLNAMPAIEWR